MFLAEDMKLSLHTNLDYPIPPPLKPAKIPPPLNSTKNKRIENRKARGRERGRGTGMEVENVL